MYSLNLNDNALAACVVLPAMYTLGVIFIVYLICDLMDGIDRRRYPPSEKK